MGAGCDCMAMLRVLMPLVFLLSVGLVHANMGGTKVMSFADVFKEDLKMPKMLLFMDHEKAPGVSEALEWVQDLTQELYPRVLPLAVTNHSENAEIFKVFSVNATSKLPLAMIVKGPVKSGQEIDVLQLQGDFTYTKLLQFGEHAAISYVTAPPDSYSEARFRVNSGQDFYGKCVEPGDARCVIFAVESENHLTQLQKFKDVVMGFKSIEAKFRFMWALGTDLKQMMNMDHPSGDFPQIVLLDPKDKLFVPLAVANKEPVAIMSFLSNFDTEQTFRGVKDKMKGREKPKPKLKYETIRYSPEQDL